jgi:hypothetical protein
MNDNCLLKNRSLRRAHQTRWSGQIFLPGFNKSPYYSQTFACHYYFTNNHTFPSIFLSKIYNLQELPSSWHVHEIWPIQGLIFTFQYFIPNLFDVRYVFTSSCLQECSCLVYVICVCLVRLYLQLFVGVLMSCLRYLCLFGSSLPPVVCRSAHVLFTLFVFVWLVFTFSCL